MAFRIMCNLCQYYFNSKCKYSGINLDYIRLTGYTQNAGYFFVKKKANRKRWIFLSEKKAKKGKSKTLDIFK